MTDDFHEQTKFVDELRERHGLPWETRELATLRELYKRGIPLREICDKMQRPKEGVLPKLVQLGLIRRVADGYRYVYWRKVLPDAGIFKDAASGVTTCADLSGLELRAASASWCRSDTTTIGRVTSPTPNYTLQTQPKEPIMKIETKVFINDQDASTYTDDQIFAEIRRAENQIEGLKAIKVQSGKLAKAIDDLQDYVNKLAAYLDAR